MHKKIQVFEYERLTIHQEYFEKRHLDALLKLNEVHNFEYFEAVKDGIRFCQYVGVIQVDDLIIEILPKADKDEDESKWQNVLIQMLKTCNKLNVDTYGDAHVNRQNLNLIEIYFNLFLDEISGLIRRGLVKQYRKETSNVKALKGKLEFAGNLKHNLAHKERFYTNHQVYDHNHLLHQVLNEAVLIVEAFSKGSFIYDKCKRVQLEFPELQRINVSKPILDKLKLNRKTNPYRKAFDLARLIILNYSPNISSGSEKMLTILFDMNKLWEEYIFIKLRESLQNKDFDIEGQSSKPFWGFNSLRPDIVIRKRDCEEIFIIDTKWKRPGQSASMDDLRQMYAYNKFWRATKALLLYPGDSIGNEFLPFEDESKQPHHCKMGFVHVLDVYGDLDKEIGVKVLAELQIEIVNHK